MCTLTWLRSNSGYQVFFNRDELKTRQRAIPPCLHKASDINYIAPIDRDAGGTWISANQQGLTFCLLNNYQACHDLPDRNWISRGLLVRDLAHLPSTDAVISALDSISMLSYRPFDLIIFELRLEPFQLAWDGTKLVAKKNPSMPITSSSFNSSEVVSGRIKRINDEHPLNSKSLLEFHSSHAPEKGAYSVCMHRDDAHTVSFSHIQASEKQITFDYRDGSPCSTATTQSLTLAYRSSLQSNVA